MGVDSVGTAGALIGDPLVSAILASIVGGALLLAGREVVDRALPLRQSSGERFWKPWLAERALVVCATTDDRSDDQTRGTGEYDLEAHQTLRSRLRSLSSDGTPKSNIEETPEHWMDRSMIAIGGPVNNEVSSFVFEQHDLPYRFDGEHNRILDGDGRVLRDPPNPRSDSFTSDSGLVTRVGHPYDEDQQVLVVAGCWGHGTAGGMTLLTAEVEAVWERTEGRPFQVLFDVEVSDETGRPAAWQFDWESLRLLDEHDDAVMPTHATLPVALDRTPSAAESMPLTFVAQ